MANANRILVINARTPGRTSKLVLGVVRRAPVEDGWVFSPWVAGRQRSRKVWPTWESALPKWTDGLDGTESIGMKEGESVADALERIPEWPEWAGGETPKPKCFLICPVRHADLNISGEAVRDLEEAGFDVHYPPRDTNQNDPIGYRICRDNRAAIAAADTVAVLWDGKSQGCLFDLGMAFALNKSIMVVDVPAKTEGKSFQNMVRHWWLEESNL